MPPAPLPPTTLSTPRLHLLRLTDTTPNSPHVQLFHENWTDPTATSWRYDAYLPHPSSRAISIYPTPLLLALKLRSLHGPTKTLEQSRLWMEEHLTRWDNWFYAVFLRDEEQVDGRGAHIGSVSLRWQSGGPTLVPSRRFEGAEEVGRGAPLSEEEESARWKELEGADLNLRVLGYALFREFHGKGYGTEACRALLDGYASAIAEFRSKLSEEGSAEKGKEVVFYVEAGVDQENLGSQNVLRKLGFKTVGMKMEKEKAWLNGAWRGPGWWITGMYL